MIEILGDKIVQSVQSDVWCSDVLSFTAVSRWYGIRVGAQF